MRFDIGAVDDERTTAWKGFLRILENDPRLRAMGTTFSTWNGSDDDASAPSDASLPYVQLTPSAAPSQWDPAGNLMSPIDVSVDCSLEGTDVTHGMKFWRVIEQALYGKPGDAVGQAAAQQALYAVGISTVKILQPAFGIDAAQSQVRQRSVGRLQLLIYVPFL